MQTCYWERHREFACLIEAGLRRKERAVGALAASVWLESMRNQSEPIDFERLDLEAEKRKAERIVLRFFDREQRGHSPAAHVRGDGRGNRETVVDGRSCRSPRDRERDARRGRSSKA